MFWVILHLIPDAKIDAKGLYSLYMLLTHHEL